MKNAILESQRLHTMAIDAQLKSEGLLVESTRCRRSIEQDCFHMSQQLESQTQEKNSILGDLDEALEREKNYRKVIQELKQQLSKTDNMVSAKMYRAVIAQCNQQNHENMVENAPQTNRNGVRVGPFLVKPSTPPKATPKQQSRAIASAGHPNNKGTKENIQIAPETDRHMSVPTVASVAASVGIDLMSVKAAARSLPRRLKPCIKNPTIVEASQNCRTPRLPTGPKPILKSKTPSRLEFPSPPQNRDCRSRRRASWVRENGGRISVQKKLQDSRSPTVNAKQINVDAKRQMYQQKLNEMNVFPTPPLV